MAITSRIRWPGFTVFKCLFPSSYSYQCYPCSSVVKSLLMSRKPAHIKVVNLEEGMPTVEQARLRMEHELHAARQQRCTAVKLIHGYGSSGAGGALRIELQ